MTMINAYARGGSDSLSAEDEALIARRESVLGPAYRLFYRTPVHFVRGEGVWLFDPDGEAYLDVYNNVASVGHCHPHVVAALARQAAILNTHTRYLNEIVVAYAERLLAKFPAELANVMFACTGSEANDLAIRITKAFTGGTGFIVTEEAYHGVTEAVASLSPSLGHLVDLGVHVRTVPAPLASGGPQTGAVFAEGVRQAIADLRRHGIRPAALLVDTIFSSDGVHADPAGFLAPAAEAIRDAGGLFIADEVQAGFGRTGEAFWGFARHGVVPDLVTMGKPMGNGHPMAGVVLKPEIAERFGKKSRYFNTFGGNPVSSAVGIAVLDVIEDEGLQQNALAVGAHLKVGLESLARLYPAIGQVRGSGLFVGIDIEAGGLGADPADVAARVVNDLRDHKVLISATGPRANVLKIRPPLVFTAANADLFLERLESVLSGL
ncbi:MAG TPA: aminotransferase class III-fold pyridoxal phosphate-dependent enzyme [Caulobacteraceae bacterium]|jgi:4-aminobutyrate aminotransferase-like enzyme|nr:aminotransferase class III-fold pyridoxal phosphate-dependent enzyme [Caulobacteraceae bacterium]